MKGKNLLRKIVTVCAGVIAVVCGTFAVTNVLAEQNSQQVPQTVETSALQYSDMFTTNSFASLNNHVTYKEQTGLQVVMHSSSAEIQYNGLIDLSDNDESSPLFELIFSPQKKGEPEIQYLTFTFTDFVDPSNYLVFKIYALANQFPNVCMVSAYGNGQSMYKSTGVSYPSSLIGSTNYPLAIYFDATTLNTKAWPTRWGKNEDRNSLDALRDLDACSGTGWVNKEEPAWEGLKSGLYNLTITAEKVHSSSASFVLTALDGVSFNKEEASVADERLSLVVDYASYDKNALPYGVVGLGYSVREATAISNFGGSHVVAPIVVDSMGDTIPVINGKFYPEKSGIYFVLYNTTSDLGNVGKKRYRVIVKDAYDEEISYEPSEYFATNVIVGDTVFLYEGVAAGGSGRLDVKSEVFYNGVEIATDNEGFCDFFIPEQAGEYLVKTHLTDYLNTTKTFESSITVLERTEKLSIGFIPNAVIKGQTFIIPKGYYLGENGTEVATVKINGENYNEDTYIPEKTFTLSYSGAGTEKTYTVQVQDCEHKTGFIANYFYVENGNIDFNKDGAMEFVSQNGNSSFDFVRPLSRELISFSFSLLEDEKDFTSIDFIIRDSIYPDKSIAVSILKEVQVDNSVKYFIVLNGGLDKIEVDENLLTSVCSVAFNYAQGTFILPDGSVIGKVSFYSNMRKYEGLSDLVYFTLSVNGVQEDNKFKLVSICNQTLMDYETDITLPEFIWEKEFVSLEQKQLNEQYATRIICGYDVLDERLDTKVTVRYNGKTVYTGKGDTSYTFKLESFGTYTVIYELSDGNGNSARSTVTVAIVDNVAPNISLSGRYSKSAKVGTAISLANVNVSDNVSNNVKIYYIIRNLKTGKEIVLNTNKYTFAQKGNYTIRILAVDEANNVSSVEYTLEVK